MTGRLALGVLLALAAAACGSAPPSPTPPAPTPASTWDPSRDEIDQAAGVWTAEQPGTYAYTSTVLVNGMGSASSRVTSIDGHVEMLAQTTSSFVGSDRMTIEALFDIARTALDGSGKLTVAIDQQYGYPSSLDYTTDVIDGSFARTIAEFTTPGDRGAKARATEALDRLLTRWQNLATPNWEYSWTRVDAASAGAPTGWIVRHGDGETTAVAAGGTGKATAPEVVTIDGTVADASAIMGSGGWVDVAVDGVTGFDVLLAIDPSPAVKGDGYWIRIDFTDRAAARQRELLDAAKARWASAKLKKYSYTWAYDGEKGAWSWTVSANRDVLTFLKKSAGAPTMEGAFAPPRIPETFDLIEQVLNAGGAVSVTYDKALGYPRKVVFLDGTAWAPEGVVTITRFKSR